MDMNLHEVLTEMCKEHIKIKKGGYADLFHFNLKTKTIKNGNTVLVENGKIIPQTIKLTDGRELVLEDDWGEIKEEFYQGVESRYEKYYYSTPSKVDKFVRTNFIAKNLEKMSFEELMSSASSNRNIARYELEWFVMANAVKENIPWVNGNWFWQSSSMPKLIIYKEWL
jgi:hypothetical protein